MKYTAVITRGEKAFVGVCPEVPEAHGQGATREECLDDLRECIVAVLSWKREEGIRDLAQGAEVLSLAMA